jgi:hypothetical protein
MMVPSRLRPKHAISCRAFKGRAQRPSFASSGRPLSAGSSTEASPPRNAQRDALRCDEQVVAGDWFSRALKRSAQPPIRAIDGRRNRHDFNGREYYFKLRRKPARISLDGAVP